MRAAAVVAPFARGRLGLYALLEVLFVNRVAAFPLALTHAHAMTNHELHQLVLIDQSNIARPRQSLQIFGDRLSERPAGHEHSLQAAVQKHRTGQLLNLIRGDLYRPAIVLNLNLNGSEIKAVGIAGNNVDALIIHATGHLGNKTKGRKNISHNMLKILRGDGVNMPN